MRRAYSVDKTHPNGGRARIAAAIDCSMTATQHQLATQQTPLADLQQHPRNPRNGDVELIAESLQVNGQYRPIVVASDGVILAGNHTYQAALALGWDTVAAVHLDMPSDSAEATRIMLADNRTADAGASKYDNALLLELLETLDEDLAGTGYEAVDLDGLAADSLDVPAVDAISLADRFVVPPLSVLRTYGGGWRDRRKHWREQHLAGHLGRQGDMVRKGGLRDPQFYEKKKAREQRLGRALEYEEFKEMWESERDHTAEVTAGTSVFDPVLAELAYRWFGKPGGTVLDPCAGGSVRGLVASVCQQHYTGIDLRAEQVEANQAQAAEWTVEPAPQWHVGDTTKADAYPGSGYDLAFTCPPYHNLEKYSDSPDDLSAMTWPDFQQAHRAMIRHTADRLKDNRFAVWVVSDVRSPDGYYRGLVADTIAAFADAGLQLYNDLILAEAIGANRIVAGLRLTQSRKIVRCHQHVLVFVKGDYRQAHAELGDVPELAAAEVVPDVDESESEK